jgi:hypothetical protein
MDDLRPLGRFKTAIYKPKSLQRTFATFKRFLFSARTIITIMPVHTLP